MFKKLFIISWIFTSLGMFFLSYLWHGFVLSDFDKNGTPSGLNLFYKLTLYLIIGFVIANAINLKFINKPPLKFMPLAKGLIVGVICGILVFLISTIKGMAFNVSLTKKDLFLNFFWQVFEQATGGIIVGFAHNLIFDPDMEEE